MKNLVRVCFVMFLLLPSLLTGCAQPATPTQEKAMAAPASDASIKELVAITEMRKLIDSIPAQLDAQMERSIQQKLAGKTVTPAQQQAVDNLKKKFSALFANEYSYDKLEPKFFPVYRETFSEEEVAGMIAFYKTPAGQAVIHKMPTLMQKTMAMVQEWMMQLMSQAQKIEQEFQAEIKEASKTP